MPLGQNQILLYAASEHDYQMALGAAAMSGLSPKSVTGNFITAWKAVAAGQQLVVAVGGAALFALYYNPCSWQNPANHPGGHTPFILIKSPTDSSPRANYFVNAAGTTALETLQIAAAYTYYAVTGKIPPAFSSYPQPMAPAERCVGKSDVPCPLLQTPVGVPTSQTGGSNSGASSGAGSGTSGSGSSTSGGGTGTRTVPYWGVDSAAKVTSAFYDCVVQTYGKPDFWGRYLTRIAGVNDGLTNAEVALLHGNGTKVLPIYNQFSQATGQSAGQQIGQQAVAAAQALGVPKGVPVFADIEVTYQVDAPWILGYVEALLASPYVPGIYANTVNGSFNGAYCQALKQNSSIEKTILWSNEPEPGVGQKQQAPTWNPSTPTCNATVLAWQYGENGSACTSAIDTDLALPGLYSQLW